MELGPGIVLAAVTSSHILRRLAVTIFNLRNRSSLFQPRLFQPETDRGGVPHKYKTHTHTDIIF